MKKLKSLIPFICVLIAVSSIIGLVILGDKSTSEYVILLKFDSVSTNAEKKAFENRFDDESIMLAVTKTRKLQKVICFHELAKDIKFPVLAKVGTYPDGFGYVMGVYPK